MIYRYVFTYSTRNRRRGNMRRTDVVLAHRVPIREIGQKWIGGPDPQCPHLVGFSKKKKKKKLAAQRFLDFVVHWIHALFRPLAWYTYTEKISIRRWPVPPPPSIRTFLDSRSCQSTNDRLQQQQRHYGKNDFSRLVPPCERPLKRERYKTGKRREGRKGR